MKTHTCPNIGSKIGEKYLQATKDNRKVIPNIHAQYYGAELTDNMLIPGKNPRLGSITFKSWFDSQKM